MSAADTIAGMKIDAGGTTNSDGRSSNLSAPNTAFSPNLSPYLLKIVDACHDEPVASSFAHSQTRGEMMASHRLQSALVLVASLAVPAIARAQDAAETFDQLRFVLAPGAEIHVLEADGRSVKGKFDAISGHSLIVTVRGTQVLLDQDTVIRIEECHDDSVANGARNGFYVGAGFGLLGGVAILMEGGSPAYLPIVTAVYGGIGAGIGVAIDALIRTPRTVYDVHARHASLAVAPVVGRTRKGVAVSVGF